MKNNYNVEKIREEIREIFQEREELEEQEIKLKNILDKRNRETQEYILNPSKLTKEQIERNIENENNSGEDFGNLLKKIKDFQNELPEELRKFQIECIPSKKEEELIINCFAYALKLDKAKYKEGSIRTDKKYQVSGAKSCFIDSLIRENYLKGLEEPEINCLVIYFDKEGMSKHAGILIKNDSDDFKKIVEDKWGDLEFIFRHPLLHVDKDYGDPKFFHSLSSEESTNLFLNYSRERHP